MLVRKRGNKPERWEITLLKAMIVHGGGRMIRTPSFISDASPGRSTIVLSEKSVPARNMQPPNLSQSMTWTDFYLSSLKSTRKLACPGATITCLPPLPLQAAFAERVRHVETTARALDTAAKAEAKAASLSAQVFE
jgi:hypothetical protein